MTKRKLRKNGFIWLMVPHYFSSLKEVKARTQIRQEPGGRGWYRDQGGVQLTGLFLMASSACFLIEPRTKGDPTLTMGCPLPHPTPNKSLRSLFTAQSYGDIFLIELPSSQMTLTCVESACNLLALPVKWLSRHGTWQAAWGPHEKDQHLQAVLWMLILCFSDPHPPPPATHLQT